MPLDQPYPQADAPIAREISYASSARSRPGLAIGAPIPPGALSHFGADSKQMMDFLRRKTYELSPEALNPARLGFEFEAQHRQAGQKHGGWRLRFGARGADGSVRP